MLSAMSGNSAMTGNGAGGVEGYILGTMDPKYWYDAARSQNNLNASDAEASISDPIKTIKDWSTYRTDITQSTADNRPTLVNDSGLALNFDGTNDLMTDTLPASVSQPFEVYTVAKFADETSGNQEYIWANSAHPHLRKQALNTLILHPGTSGFVGSAATAAYELFNAQINGASSALIRDGTQDATGGSGSSALARILLASSSTAGANFFAGRIKEHIVFAGLLAAADQSIVESYLLTKHIS